MILGRQHDQAQKIQTGMDGRDRGVFANRDLINNALYGGTPMNNESKEIQQVSAAKEGGLWKRGEIAEYGSFSYSMAGKIIARPDFPKPLRLDGKGHARWFQEEVKAWFRSQRRKAA